MKETCWCGEPVQFGVTDDNCTFYVQCGRKSDVCNNISPCDYYMEERFGNAKLVNKKNYCEAITCKFVECDRKRSERISEERKRKKRYYTAN